MSIKYDAENRPFIDMGEGYKIQQESDEISDEKYKEKAEKELRESEVTKAEGIKKLKELIESELSALVLNFEDFQKD
jgi:hypothetical protein